MKQKIVFFMANLASGGAERVTTNIIKKLNNKDFEIFLIMVSQEGSFLEEIPSYVKIINLNAKKTIFSIFKFRKTIKSINPDIIYSTMQNTSIAQYLALLKVKTKPFILLRHPISPKTYFSQKSGIKTISWKFLLSKAYLSANKVLAQTPEMKRELYQYYNTPIDKIDVFFNPLDELGIKKGTTNINNPFNPSKINVVASGRLAEQKAFDILLNAFKIVIKNNPKFVLHIIGRDDGKQKELLIQHKELELGNNVVFLGFQKNPYRFYYFSDLFVLSSRREGLPNTVLENLYLKKPVIATKCIPFLSTLIKTGENGLLVEVDNVGELSSAILNFQTLTSKGFLKKHQPSNPNKYFKQFRKS